MPLNPNGPAPYTSANTATAAITAYRDRGLGIPVTTDVLIRAGIPESIANRTLQSLRLLELVDENGQPTHQLDGFRQARGDEEFKARLEEWLRGVYADVLQYADPSTDSIVKVQEAFRTYVPSGQRKAMASLLAGLWEFAGLPMPSQDGTEAPRSAKPRPPRHPQTRKQTQRPPAGQTHKTPPPPLSGLPEGLVGFLREIPTGGRSWTSDRRSEFLKALGVIIDFYVPVNDNPQDVEAQTDEEGES